ncbi:putative E3 ubiquitin-protein ligase HIP1 [Camellia lanceoleosa]|uniref:E3 ubiquitin-protein ligase HIP1 n=1 Tax=Camellia lanceoleosa TaxID=1840588 RepID=A0ACC0IS00_9ERIC|nr:putative E3 ubiquitin-protein ligase HIP1 [Camellia lanceoleosa]
MEALKLAPCAMAAQDEKSDVPDNICQQVKKLGQNPGCLCAVVLSDTAKFLSNLFGVPCKSYIGLSCEAALLSVNEIRTSSVRGTVLCLSTELAEETEQLQEGVLESGVVVTLTKPKKGKAALPLKSDRDGIIVHEQPLFYEEPDVHENMRLYVDDMSYEELLTLEDQIGNVSTGLSEEAMLAAVRWHCYLSMKLGPPVEEESCCYIQEDYVDGKELGKLNCGHEFHLNCIKQWLV